MLSSGLVCAAGVLCAHCQCRARSLAPSGGWRGEVHERRARVGIPVATCPVLGGDNGSGLVVSVETRPGRRRTSSFLISPSAVHPERANQRRRLCSYITPVALGSVIPPPSSPPSFSLSFPSARAAARLVSGRCLLLSLRDPGSFLFTFELASLCIHSFIRPVLAIHSRVISNHVLQEGPHLCAPLPLRLRFCRRRRVEERRDVQGKFSQRRPVCSRAPTLIAHFDLLTGRYC